MTGSDTRALAASGLLALGWALWRGRQRLRVTRAELAGCAVIGLLLPLLRATSVSIVATYAYVDPVIAVWLGWLVHSEPVTGTTLLDAAVVIAAVALVVVPERRTA